MTVARREIPDEHDLYPVHEEDSVPETPQHERQVRYLRDALSLRFPDRWVTGDACMYWEELAFGRYQAPDVLVVDRKPPEELPRVYLAWSDGAALMVIEIGSRSTLKEDEGPKVERYLLDLNVAEYLYYRPHKNPRRRRMQMWRLVGDDACPVAPLPNGRLRSETLELEFGPDATGFIRAYERDGTVLPDAEELKFIAGRAEARARAERQRADELQSEVERLRAELARRERPTRRRQSGTNDGD